MHNWWPDTWESNSWRQRHPAFDDEELSIIEGSPAATGAQLRDNLEEREKWPKRPANCFQTQFPYDPNTVETLLAAAVYLLLLDAPECRRTSGSWDVTAVVALQSCGENQAAVGEVVRRVLLVGIDTELGLTTCVCLESDWQYSRGRREDFRFQPKALTRLRVVTENRWERKQSWETSLRSRRTSRSFRRSREVPQIQFIARAGL